MILLRKYKPEDFNIPDAIEPFCSPTDDTGVAERGIAVTAEDGDTRACGGIVYTSETEGMIWMKISKKCERNAYRWARTLKEGFKIMIDSVDIKVYTYILSGFCSGERLARSLGMTKTDETEDMNDRTYYKWVA